MGIDNHMYIKFDAKSMNEGVARMTAAAFMMNMNPTLDEIQDVKTAVSEAVTNAIIHGYPEENMMSNQQGEEHQVKNEIEMVCVQEKQRLQISIIDKGVGIENVEEARQPFFTTKPEQERSGMGFAFMETFMDILEVESKAGQGTKVTMTKYIERTDEQ